MLTMCNVPGSVLEELGCYADFMTAAEEFQTYGEVKLSELQAMLDDPEGYEAFDEDAVAELVDRSNSFMSDLPTLVEDCEATANIAGVADLCNACPIDLPNLLGELESTSVRPAQPPQQETPVPGAGMLVNQYRVDTGQGQRAARGKMCGLTKIAGKFSSTKDKVGLMNLQQDAWVVYAHSNLQKLEDHPYTIMSCVDDVYERASGSVSQVVKCTDFPDTCLLV
jgi:hypothetical protein